ITRGGCPLSTGGGLTGFCAPTPLPEPVCGWLLIGAVVDVGCPPEIDCGLPEPDGTVAASPTTASAGSNATTPDHIQTLRPVCPSTRYHRFCPSPTRATTR